MSANNIIDLLTEAADESNVCVVLRSGDGGLETVLVADEKGRWSIPGGQAETGESHAEAAKREVKEETGLDIEPVPLFWANHAGRRKSAYIFYAVTDDADIHAGGGDVKEVKWVSVNDLGSLNGTDQLAIHSAATRVHDTNRLVDDAVDVAESLGYAVSTVAAPTEPVPGAYVKIIGAAADAYILKLGEHASSAGWTTAHVQSTLFESTSAALERAKASRRLTPVLECLIHAADVLWRYESAVAPKLSKGIVVFESGPSFDLQHFLYRGVQADMLENISERLPKPELFRVGDTVDTAVFDSIVNSVNELLDNGTH